MRDFLIDPRRLASATEPLVLVIRRQQTEMRRTDRHNHGRGQLLGTMRGLVALETELGRWLIPPINAIWIPPHVEHEFASHGAFHGWSVYVAEAACAGLPERPRVIRLSGLLTEAVARAAGWEAGSLSDAQQRIAGVILDEIAALPTEAFELPMPVDPRLQTIARCILDDPAARQRMEDWAAFGGIAPRSLSRRFVLETGLTFSAWRQRALLLRSLEMLAAGNSVTAIAFDLGYETISAFIDLFRTYFGTTPGRYFKPGET
ncbi:MAG: helix-turn-helix domain-containing protein [Rhizobium sp.]|nr:MAG: helix-turn-helix domain-containing protein [Rhizobium sp.]